MLSELEKLELKCEFRNIIDSDVLKDVAKYQRELYKSYRNAGFSAEDALRLLSCHITGKSLPLGGAEEEDVPEEKDSNLSEEGK